MDKSRPEMGVSVRARDWFAGVSRLPALRLGRARLDPFDQSAVARPLDRIGAQIPLDLGEPDRPAARGASFEDSAVTDYGHR